MSRLISRPNKQKQNYFEFVEVPLKKNKRVYMSIQNLWVSVCINVCTQYKFIKSVKKNPDHAFIDTCTFVAVLQII